MANIISLFIEYAFLGLVYGSLIGIAAVGLTLSYGVTNFINLAYGEYITYGAFISFAILSIGIPFSISVILSIVSTGILGVLLWWTVFEPLEDKGPFPLLMTSLGLMLIMRHMLSILTPTNITYRFPIPSIKYVSVGGALVSPINMAILIVAIFILVIFHYLLKKTMLGKKMRAYSGNKQLARVSGINTEKVINKTWLLSAGAAGISGIMLGVFSPPFNVSMGWGFLLPVFGATILGGIGKPYGAMIGAVITGLAISLGTMINPNYATEYGFIVLIGAILFLPEGIAGGEMHGS